MKKISIVATCMVGSICLSAQDDVTHKNAIKLNPLSLVFATGNVAYERVVTRNTSIQLGVFYSGVSISGLKYTGLGITPEFRVYIAGDKQALNGVYVGPYVRYQSFSLKDKNSNDEAKYTSVGGGAIVGWEKAWSSGFVLDVFAGPAYNSGKVKERTGNSNFNVAGGIDGFGLRAGINIGFAF